VLTVGLAEAAQEVAFELDQDKVADELAGIVIDPLLLFALKSTVGTFGGGGAPKTLRVTVSLLLPPAPVHVITYVRLAVWFPVD
jgi:hypothetical protein